MTRAASTAAVLAVIALAPGCGGDAAGGEDVAAVEAGVVALGTTQNVSCEELGSEEVEGTEATVYTCSFEEEAEQSGEMRPARRCFTLADDGSVADVTAVLRARGSCPVIGP